MSPDRDPLRSADVMNVGSFLALADAPPGQPGVRDLLRMRQCWGDRHAGTTFEMISAEVFDFAVDVLEAAGVVRRIPGERHLVYFDSGRFSEVTKPRR